MQLHPAFIDVIAVTAGHQLSLAGLKSPDFHRVRTSAIKARDRHGLGVARHADSRWGHARGAGDGGSSASAQGCRPDECRSSLSGAADGSVSWSAYGNAEGPPRWAERQRRESTKAGCVAAPAVRGGGLLVGLRYPPLDLSHGALDHQALGLGDNGVEDGLVELVPPCVGGATGGWCGSTMAAF